MGVRILFDLKKEYYFNALYPVYCALADDKRYDIWFNVGADHKRYFKLILVSRRGAIEKSLRGRGLQITRKTEGFDAVVCGDALKKPERYGDTLRIHLDHGMGIKTLRIRNIKRQAGYRYQVFLEGRYWYEYIKSLGWEECADFHITGIPKLDPFFWPGHYNRSAIMQRLGLDPEKKTVLFAPSYKPSCIDHIRDTVCELAPRYNLVIKLHPYSWGGKYAPHAQHKRYERAAAQHPEVVLVPRDEFDVYPYLFIADTLISDTSSVVNEFLALGRHGIIYDLPETNPLHSDGMPVLSLDTREWLAGSFVHLDTSAALRDAVEQALHPTGDMVRKLGEDRDYFFTGLDGKAGQRVKKVMDGLLGLGGD